MNGKDHPVFASAPLKGKTLLSTGPAPTPYHVYDGHGLLIVGICDAANLAPALADQDVYPVLTCAGNAIVNLFVCDFTDASLGPHLEFHITALCAPEPGHTLPDDPAAALSAFATQHDWGALSLHLWNDTDAVVAYNSEYLGLGAAQANGHVNVRADQADFGFTDARGAALASGSFRLNRRSDAGLMLRVMRHLGLRGLWQALRKKPALAHLINRKSKVLPRNRRAQTRTAPDHMIVSAFDPAHDRLNAHSGPLSALGFVPQIFEHVFPFRFVYLHPDDA